MVASGLFISSGAANHSSTASRYVAALALAATPPFNLSSSPLHVNSLVLQSIAVEEQPAALYDTAISHAISGAKAASIPLFVGTIIPRSGSGDEYCSQVVLNASYVAEVVQASTRAAKAFITRYGHVHHGWYVTQEAFLNFLGEGCHAVAFGRHLCAAEVAAGYSLLMQKWTQALEQISPGLPILWSPAAPESPRHRANGTSYAANLATSLRSIAAAAPSITNLTIQDSVGKASNVSGSTVRYAVGCDDALFHANIARAALAHVHVAINMELFLRTGHRDPPSAIVDLPADPRETERRAICYAEGGFDVGPSWEIGYWYRQLTEEWALPRAEAEEDVRAPLSYPPPPAPVLNIDPHSISVSGISSGADFSVQFATAFSKHVRGVGVFAGQPFHCAVTRFPLDQTFECEGPHGDIGEGRHSDVGPAGCQTKPFPLPSIPAAPPGQGLLWDHCKGCTVRSKMQLQRHPNLVNMSMLYEYAVAIARAGKIDDVAHLASMRAYVYRGTKDACYTEGVMQQTAQWFRHFARNKSQQVRFVDTVPSLHAIPTLDYGTTCGTEARGKQMYAPGAMHGLEACGYDGPGEALKHIYGADLRPPTNSSAIDFGRILPFDQRPFGMLQTSSRDMAFARTGYMYVPKRCEDSAATVPCKLHVFFHGCGSAFNDGWNGHGNGFNYTFIAHAGFSAWGEANDIAVLFPQKDSTKETCWDGYGWGGPDWATKRGGQMAAVWKLISHVAGGKVS